MVFLRILIILSGISVSFLPANAQLSCSDSSVHIRYESDKDSFQLVKQVLSGDGGRIAIGNFEPTNRYSTNSLVVKFGADHAVNWSRRIIPDAGFSDLRINNIAESGNGNIALSGILNTPDGRFHFFMALLSPSGNFLSQNTIDFTGIPGFVDLYHEALFVDRLSGDSLLFAFYTDNVSPAGERICLVTTDNNGIAGSTWMLGVPTTNDFRVSFYRSRLVSGKLWLYGSSTSSISCIHPGYKGANHGTFIAVEMDLITKKVLSQKLYCEPEAVSAGVSGFSIGYDYPKEIISGSLEYYQNVFFLANGGVAISRAYQRFTTLPGPLNWLFNISYFDGSFNPIRSEFITAQDIFKNYVVQEVTIDSDGTKHFSFADYATGNIYYSVADASDRLFLNKRIPAPWLDHYWYDNRLNTTAPGKLTSFTVQNITGNHSIIDHFEILAKDTAAECFGTDTSYLSVVPVPLTQASWTGPVTSEPSPVSLQPLNFTTADFSLLRQDICVIRHICDTVKISAVDTVCGLAEPVMITVKKNKYCDSKINFGVDISAPATQVRVNDTTLLLSFNKPWQGNIIATLQDCPSMADTVSLAVFDKPVLNLQHNISVCAGTTATLHAGNNFKSYVWQDNSRDSVLQVNKAGLYTVTATDYCGHAFSDSVIITVKDCREYFFVPSAFTPNYDGKNDQFKPYINGPMEKYELLILNRWGQVIFKTSDPSRYWDGTFKGKPQDPGVYIWECSYRLADQQTQVRKGTVTLLR